MVNFYLDSRTNSRGDCSIRQSVTICGARFVANTGLSVRPEFWDRSTQSARTRRALDPVNGKAHTAARLNGDLASISAYWQRLEATATDAPTAAAFRELWNTYTGKGQKGGKASPVLNLLSNYAASQGRTWSEGTRTKWDTFARILTDSGIYSTVEDLASPERAAAFVDYLRGERRQKDSTACKYFSILCRVVRYGERVKTYEPGTADALARGERFTQVRQPVIYLTREELGRFLSFDTSSVAGKVYTYGGKAHRLNPDTLAAVRDVFCFCALTSLRISDALALCWANVVGNALHLTTQKTCESLKIDLNARALEILARRYDASLENLTPFAHVFESVGPATMNEYIKTLGYLCDVSEPVTRTYVKGGHRQSETRPKYELLSSHAARRTFIVTALSLGIPPAVVMKFTGHSNYAAMRPYIDITETAQAEAMRLFDTL